LTVENPDEKARLTTIEKQLGEQDVTVCSRPNLEIT